jgi:hypothetical protein
MTILASTLTHLTDNKFVEHANTVLLLGILWVHLLSASSARSPMTLPTGLEFPDQWPSRARAPHDFGGALAAFIPHL